ncbi:MAG TPA: head GIN domain-containing protein [Longimicrobiales bacterium]
MRNKIRLAVVLAGGALVLGGCTDILGDRIIDGRGPVVYESRPVGSFTAISNSTNVDVEILYASNDRVWVRAEESLIPYIRTHVRNGVLRIYTDDVTLRPRQEMVVEVDVRMLRRIDSSGSGFIFGDLLNADRLEVNTSGSGDINLPSLLADSLIVFSSGAGDVTASGDVERLRLSMSASGRVNTEELNAFEADAAISGSGNATIRVRDYLRAVLSGSGNLRYYGSPAVDETVTGTGRVERLGS